MKSVVLIMSLISVYWMLSFKSAETRTSAPVVAEDEGSDPLTGLLARQTIDASLQRELLRTHRASQSLSLVVADVDGFFKLENDIGDVAADQTLIGIAQAVD